MKDIFVEQESKSKKIIVGNVSTKAAYYWLASQQ